MDAQLIHFSTEELQEELERRNKMASIPWPRSITLKGYVEVENIGEVTEELALSHGINEESKEWDKIYRFLTQMKFDIEFDQDGNCKLIAVDGRKLE
jgi:hypothetical protein